MEAGYMHFEPNVAQSDQSRQEAIDALRKAESYVLIVPGDDEEELGIHSHGTAMYFLHCRHALDEALREVVIAALDEEEDDDIVV